ncbi:MAG: DUF554 domain-containing protein [Chroococcales cyanobacterium]
MTLSFWIKTSGTWFNVITIIVGTGLGIFLKDLFSSKMQQVISQGIGLLTLWVGINLANHLIQVKAGMVDGVILALLAIVIGGLLGEWWQIEERLIQAGNWLKKVFRGQGRFTEGFVSASLIFCIGSLAIVGSLQNGLQGDPTLLILKSSMDGVIAIALGSSYGIGVGFSSLPILIYQGGLSVLAGGLANFFPDPSNDLRLFLVNGVGGLLILGIGLNLLEIAKIRVASFLPALLLAPLFYQLAITVTN